MMKGLALLQSKLEGAFAPTLAKSWTQDNGLDAQIHALKKFIQQGSVGTASLSMQEEAVKAFWPTMKLNGFKDTRLVSYGITLPVGPQRLCVIEDRQRFSSLLDGVDKFKQQPRLFRRCYHGLMQGYFSYDPESKHTPDVGVQNWQTLRTYLGERAGDTRSTGVEPSWVDSIHQHSTLFGVDPCGRYGPKLLAGDDAEVNELREVLGISDSTWFMRKLYLAQVVAATQKPASEFTSLVPRIVELLQHKSADQVCDQGLALLLNRLASLTPAPLSVPLKDAVVHRWGNPWLQLNAMRWGRVSPEARAMVTEWLKLEFIETFFTLLAEEKAGDTRRLDFWKRFVNAIEEIHFALGRGALQSTSPDFVTLRRKMNGLIVQLDDSNRDNNAFIMRLGPLVVVEFSGDSNACYGYNASKSLPFMLDRPVVTRKDSRNSLKRSDRALWLQHQDGIHGYAKWETRFLIELAKYGVQPRASAANAPMAGHKTTGSLSNIQKSNSQPSVHPLKAWIETPFSTKSLQDFAAQQNLIVADFRPINGNLWVRTDNSKKAVNDVLTSWGFMFKNNEKGWWRS